MRDSQLLSQSTPQFAITTVFNSAVAFEIISRYSTSIASCTHWPWSALSNASGSSKVLRSNPPATLRSPLWSGIPIQNSRKPLYTSSGLRESRKRPSPPFGLQRSAQLQLHQLGNRSPIQNILRPCDCYERPTSGHSVSLHLLFGHGSGPTIHLFFSLFHHYLCPSSQRHSYGSQPIHTFHFCFP